MNRTPTRRQALGGAASALGACLAGCASFGNASNTRRRVSLERVDEVPSEHDLTITVEPLESSVTPEHTARVRVTTTNEGARRDVSISEGMCCLFDRSRGASDPPGLWLHRPEVADGIERKGDRWTRDAPADQPRGYPAYGCLAHTYDPGESVSNDYLVWDDYRVSGYLEPGVYRFAEPVTVSPAGSEGRDDGAEFTWGFDLRVGTP